MKIERTGDCPIYLNYITRQALIPRSRELNPELFQLTRFGFHWIDVPSFQRGMVWSEELLEELLASRSVFLGNAILGSFPVDRTTTAFANMPVTDGKYEVLIDGLQRFSIGTAILSILYPLVLIDIPERADDAGYFEPLKLQAATWGPVFLHNDYELKNHPRRAVADSYQNFHNMLKTWIVGRFDRGEARDLADKTVRLFLQRQIAPDIYHGFSTVYEIASTFIGLNTIRAQLNIVDWLRSVIIDEGGQSGWTTEVIESLENRFSETFNRENGDGPKAELIPLASILKEILTEGSVEQRKRVFPSWGSTFLVSDVEKLLEFINQVWEHDENAYAREVRLCGAIPFAALILYFYRRLLSESYEASFLKGGDLDDSSLLDLLRGYYRVVFEGSVARTREYAKSLILLDETLQNFANRLSKSFVNKLASESVDRDWLVAMLKAADNKRARQIFNACLLPEHGTSSAFNPHRYGASAKNYQIDHMIPASVLELHQPGGIEGNLLMNFAPIRKTTNVSQRNIMCSHKLSEGGVYQMECINYADAHPYLRWLVETQGNEGNRLDLQELLQTAALNNLAAQRIEWIANRLANRL